jgi:hypothetical protein
MNMTATAGSYSFESGSNVWAHNDKGEQIKGTLLNDLVWDESEANRTYQISVLYSKDQGYVNCQVGALYLSSQANLQNCKSSKNLGNQIIWFCLTLPNVQLAPQVSLQAVTLESQSQVAHVLKGMISRTRTMSGLTT